MYVYQLHMAEFNRQNTQEPVTLSIFLNINIFFFFSSLGPSGSISLRSLSITQI